ncbi:MAG: T9SS type A sorting domain-containing protein, partial [bacterium]|nr:T9SS type A sorting domain-containing protein [bacterium]
SGWDLIWRSEDSGENWDQMTEIGDYTGANNGTIVPIMVVNQSGILFLGARELSISNDQGDNWQPVPTGQDQTWFRWIGEITDIIFDFDGYLVLGTANGIVRSTIPMNGPLAEEEEPDLVVPTPVLPETFLLSVYPNPFNGILRVNINAEQNQPYSVSIFDNTGRLVSVLSKGIGSSQLVWDASNNPSGLYWVQSVVDNKHLTKGVYLVR